MCVCPCRHVACIAQATPRPTRGRIAPQHASSAKRGRFVATCPSARMVAKPPAQDSDDRRAVPRVPRGGVGTFQSLTGARKSREIGRCCSKKAPRRTEPSSTPRKKRSLQRPRLAPLRQDLCNHWACVQGPGDALANSWDRKLQGGVRLAPHDKQAKPQDHGMLCREGSAGVGGLREAPPRRPVRMRHVRELERGHPHGEHPGVVRIYSGWSRSDGCQCRRRGRLG